MQNIHIVSSDVDTRQSIEALLRAQRFQVTTHATEIERARVVIFDERGLGLEQTDAQAKAIVATGIPALVIVDPPMRGKEINTKALNERKLAIEASGGTACRYDPDQEANFVTSVRAVIIRNQPAIIHVIEDDDAMRAGILKDMTEAGFQVSASACIADARTAFQDGPIDLFLVDRKLPDGDGLDFIRELRHKRIMTPAIVLTIWNDWVRETEGIEAGANDYIGKPVENPAVLVARIQCALKARELTLIFGPLEISVRDSISRWKGRRIEGLTKRDQEVLTYLAERADLEIPLDMIIEDIWGRLRESWDNLSTTERHGPVIARKRAIVKLFEELGIPNMIVAEGSSYRFDPRPLLSLDGVQETT